MQSTPHTPLGMRDTLNGISCQVQALRLFFHLDEALSTHELYGIDLLFQHVVKQLDALEISLRDSQ